ADDLAADAALGGRAARDQAVGRGQDRGAHPAEDARQAVLARVDAAAGLGDALEIGDHALAIAAELEVDHQRVVGALLLLVLLLLVELAGADDPVVADVALLLEQPRDLGLQARTRHLRALVQSLVCVPDPRQHVCDRVSLHRSPARFGHAGDDALVGQVPQADPAEAELPVGRARAPAAVAAVVRAG